MNVGKKSGNIRDFEILKGSDSPFKRILSLSLSLSLSHFCEPYGAASVALVLTVFTDNKVHGVTQREHDFSELLLFFLLIF